MNNRFSVYREPGTWKVLNKYSKQTLMHATPKQNFHKTSQSYSWSVSNQDKILKFFNSINTFNAPNTSKEIRLTTLKEVTLHLTMHIISLPPVWVRNSNLFSFQFRNPIKLGHYYFPLPVTWPNKKESKKYWSPGSESIRRKKEIY